MKHCDMCRVNVRGNPINCPLCGAKLNGEGEKNVYPPLTTIYKRFHIFFKILILSTVGVVVASICVNLVVPKTGKWSLFVLFGFTCFWICFLLIMRKRDNIPKNIVIQVFVGSIFSIIWDFITGWHGWSLEYVLPIVCIGAMIAMAIVAKVLNIPVEDYIICLFADVFFGIIPLIFYILGLINQTIPSVVCIGFSFMSFVALLVFQGKNMKIELMKRFHY